MTSKLYKDARDLIQSQEKGVAMLEGMGAFLLRTQTHLRAARSHGK